MTVVEFKRELRKFGKVTFTRSITSNSIYVEVEAPEGTVLGRISDHNKSFQHEGDVSVVSSSKMSVVEFKKVLEILFDEFIQKFIEKFEELGFSKVQSKVTKNRTVSQLIRDGFSSWNFDEKNKVRKSENLTWSEFEKKYN